MKRTAKEEECLSRSRPDGLRGLEMFGYDPATGMCSGAPSYLVEEQIIAYWKRQEE